MLGRVGNDPEKTFQLVSFEGIPGFIPTFPEHQQDGCGSKLKSWEMLRRLNVCVSPLKGLFAKFVPEESNGYAVFGGYHVRGA